MTRNIQELQIMLEHERDRVQTLVDLLAAVLATAGGVMEIRPADVAAAQRKSVVISEGAGLVLVRLTSK